MKSPTNAKPSLEKSGPATGMKPKVAASNKPDQREGHAVAEAAPATWPFSPGTQGDHKAIETKPVQRAGWNARQFRI